MLWTKTFIPTQKEIPQEAESTSHRLLLRAGLIRMLMAGVYSYLPLGLLVLRNIERIIRREMAACGASELLLPGLQPLELWQKTGRDVEIAEVMFRFRDRRKRNLCLGPTHEEVITDLARTHISSYKQLPLILYQIQTKFRDEIRPRFGLVRACEFVMKDAYSFDRDEAGLDKSYRLVYDAYSRIFNGCGLKVLVSEADPGIMGGSTSHEFMVVAAEGEDLVEAEGAKLNCIEVGHIFKLGIKYSAKMGANFLDQKGKASALVMGCYGIGVSRLISAIIAQNNDEDGIIWPRQVAPYQVIILPLESSGSGQINIRAQAIYKRLKETGVSVLLDDRQEQAGVKFKDADLLGIPLQVIIGSKYLKERSVELKLRRDNQRILESEENILKRIEQWMAAH